MATKTKQRRVAKSQCGFEGCTNKAHSRGRCQGHLSQFWGEIEDGQYTEDDAIASGKLDPRQKAGRPRGKRSRQSKRK